MIPDDQPNKLLVTDALYPPAQVGTMQLRYQYSRMDLKGQPTWSYIPGQRRVRMAPEFTYDGVAPSVGGVLLYDEINGFDGKMDRFDFKLLGRKEMFVPYNNSDAQLGSMEIHAPNISILPPFATNCIGSGWWKRPSAGRAPRAEEEDVLCR